MRGNVTTRIDDEPASLAGGELAAAAVDGARGGRVVAPRKRRRSQRVKRVKRATIVTHRWLSLVLGIALLVITTSGAAVLYSPEWTKWTNQAAFRVGHSDQPISMTEALADVNAAHPRFKAASVNGYDGLYEVFSADDDTDPGFWGVDPSSGRLTGYVNPNRGVMAFMLQVHECFFTCEDYPGYISWMNHPMPTLGMHWLKDVTVAGFILGGVGLLLLFLAVSGIWLWWPSLRRFADGWRVRTRKGRYARDYDLHQVFGIVAVPFLLMWGLTGASFEFHWVNTAWYAVTGGEQVPDTDFTSAKAPAHTPDIGLDAAITAGRAKAGPNAELVYASLPDAGDKTATYDLWFSRNFDQYKHGAYPGQFEVEVDRHNAARVRVNDYGTAPTLSNKILDDLGPATFHYGESFNGWWRLIWLAFGLTPLVLAVTGLSTWLAKRTVKKRRKRAATAATVTP
jgi:uncharacterized iron-regulated membrane protein